MNFLIFLAIWLSGVLVTRFVIALSTNDADDDAFAIVVLKRLTWIFSWIILVVLILATIVEKIINFFENFDDNVRKLKKQ